MQVVQSSLRSRSRRAITLVELLVALAAAMILLTTVITILGSVTRGVQDSRASIEITGRLRSAQLLLRSDLAGATCPTLVWQRKEGGNGYLEIIEGTRTNNNGSQLQGDTDDVIMFTTRAVGGRFFTAKANNTTITSDKAEVVWFLSKPKTYPDGTQVFNLYRRLYLIVNDTQQMRSLMTGGTYQNCDITFRPDGNGTRIACSLGDLSNRRYRVYHNQGATAFPHALNTTYSNNNYNGMRLTGAREGEDIVLSDVIGFDVKVFDPTAGIGTNGNVGVLPSDGGYQANGATNVGAYVDLGRGVGSQFGNSTMEAKSRLTGLSTYDTWCFDYENDGVDQDNVNGADQYTDGLDNDNQNGIDDAGERETMPPYPYPLRGVQIKIRVYEPSSKLVREVTVEETFVP
jgi:type II secretory pathway component PulJ